MRFFCLNRFLSVVQNKAWRVQTGEKDEKTEKENMWNIVGLYIDDVQ